MYLSFTFCLGWFQKPGIVGRELIILSINIRTNISMLREKQLRAKSGNSDFSKAEK